MKPGAVCVAQAVDIQGEVADGFEPLRETFERNFAERGDRGAAVAVHLDGRKVVDLWGGVRDADAWDSDAGAAEGGAADAGAAGGGASWARDTAVLVRSATKGVAAAVPLLLHERGLLDLDAPVGSYWPEFKAAGKEHVTVSELLAHRAGLAALDAPLTPARAADGESAARALAEQAPFWEPGTAHGYHAQTYGWLLSELVLRVTGHTLGRFLAEEVTGPRGLDFRVGVPDAAADHAAGRLARVAAVEPPARTGTLKVRARRDIAEAWADPESLTRRAFAAVTPLPDENDPAWLAADLPGSAGVGTARALSGFYAATFGATEDGPRLLTPASTALAGRELSAGPDRVLIARTRFGPGWMLHGPAAPMLSPASYGHPGRGGSLGFADPDAGIGFGYVTNGLAPSVTADPRAQALVRTLRTILADRA
ncbi:serine hydrolase domain-containing protein [Streptomyces sp. BI20]|uniref:serine hydrolase domain-containing protein n=1 Tax=Streptomyces sp. BI20 TaxID=3403460 RepID=UPI003C715881